MRDINPLLAAIGELDKDAVADALAAFHTRNVSRAPQDGGASPKPSYEAARRTLREREKRLGQERSLVEGVLAGLGPKSAAPAPLPQQELLIVGAAGGLTGGRFRLLNTFSRPLRVAFAPGYRDNGQAPPPLRFSPATPELPPERDVVIRLEIDLTEERAGEPFTVPIDINEGPRLRQRLWLTVRCLPATGAGTP